MTDIGYAVIKEMVSSFSHAHVRVGKATDILPLIRANPVHSIAMKTFPKSYVSGLVPTGRDAASCKEALVASAVGAYSC